MIPLSTPAEALGGSLGPLAKGRLAAEIFAAYLTVRRTTRRHDIRTTLERLRGEGPAPDAEQTDPATLALGVRLGRAVERTLSPLPSDTRCLARSLVLTSLLARRGVPSSLVIAARPGGTFLAHAWVELAGRPLLSPGEYSDARLVAL